MCVVRLLSTSKKFFKDQFRSVHYELAWEYFDDYRSERGQASYVHAVFPVLKAAAINYCSR